MRCLGFIIFSLDLLFSVYVVSESMVTHTTFMRPRDCKPKRKEAVSFLGGSSAKIRFILTCCERSSVYDIRKIGLD